MKHRPITPASLSWQDNTPVSEQFDDIYFNKDGGLAETDYVFIQGNRLPERFAEFNGQHFTLAETGFGTGLNFLCARQLWLQHSQPGQQLHFISVEKYPLAPDDLQQALSQLPELKSGTNQLIAQYPPALAGFHRLSFDNGRVQLTLMLGDADECYPQLDARVDGWFLDGFAPAKNPEMWSETLFRNIARCSHAGTTFATFTAAGVVKRGLQGAGFKVRKISGFGRKREMLIGDYEAETQPLRNDAPWFQRPQRHLSQPSEENRITVIGAGLSGLCAAWSLAQRGHKVQVLERAAQIAANGSGNRQGALYAKPTLEATKQSRLHLSGMLYSQRWLHQLDPERRLWDDCGVLLSAQNEKVSRRFEQIIKSGHIPTRMLQHLTTEQASRITGHNMQQDAVFFPAAGWVNPAALCQRLSEHPLIEVRCNWPVNQLSYNIDQQQWLIHGQTEILYSSIVIVACATESLAFSQTAMLPLKPIRGQVTHAATENISPLKTVVCADGYISPPLEGQYCFGATFDIADMETDLRHQDQQYNLKTLTVALPELAQQLASSLTTPQQEKQYSPSQGHSFTPAQLSLQGRVGWRCASNDYLPLVGEVPDQPTFIEQYARLRQDAHWPFPLTPPARHHGLFISVGHGSKGLITCPISGELLAAQICSEPLPTDREVCDAVDPCRFLVKNLIRQTI